MDEVERREAAIARLEARREFWMHLFIYVAVNALLVMTWAISGRGYFWPIWPLAGWGIGLGAHAIEVFRRPLGEDRIRREMEKL